MKKELATSLLALAIPLMMVGSAQAAEPAAPALNPDGSKTHVEYPLDPSHKAILDEKNKLAQMHQDVRAGKVDQASFDKAMSAFEAKVGKPSKEKIGVNSTGPVLTPTTGPIYHQALSSSRYINTLLQEAQINSYYCGPATVASIVKSKDVSLTQSAAATYMHTTTDGTPWYTNTYPVRDALNHYLNTSWYTAYGTSVTAAQFESDVTLDIDDGYGVAGNAWEVPGGPHLVGHPNTTIYHWFAIDGYSNWGDSTHYADSVHNATSISWYASVPAYSTLATTTVATIVDGRGIIW